MISAFGVDHGDGFSKAERKSKGEPPSTGRRVLASAPFTSAFHPIVAGKRGKKLRATGNQWGGSFVGGTAGAVVGGALSRGNPGTARLGSLAGGVAGSQGGLNRNTRKGYLKREQ